MAPAWHWHEARELLEATGPDPELSPGENVLWALNAYREYFGERGEPRCAVLVSAFGAGDTAEKASGFARLIYRTVFGKFFADKAASDAMLTASGLDHTIVYPGI